MYTMIIPLSLQSEIGYVFNERWNEIGKTIMRFENKFQSFAEWEARK